MSRTAPQGDYRPCTGPCLYTWCLVLFLLTFLKPLNALYRDQDGKYNWISHHIGQYKAVAACGSRLAVMTDDGVLASLNPRDGQIYWRKVFEDGEKIHSISCARMAVVAVTSNALSSSRVRVFSEQGAQMWEHIYGPLSASSALRAVLVNTSNGYSVVVVAPGLLQSRALQTGALEWEHDQVTAGALEVLIQISEADSILVGSYTKNTMALNKLRMLDGGIIETELSRDLPTVLRIGEAVLTDTGLAALSADGAKICHASFGNMNGDCIAVGDGGIEEVKAGCDGTLVTRTSTGTTVLQVTQDGKKLDAIFSTLRRGPISECVENRVAIAVESGEGLFVLQFDNLKQSELVPLEASPRYYDGVRIQPSLVGLHKNSRWFVQFNEGTTLSGSMKSDAATLHLEWSRFDGLAYTTDSMFADLPEPNAANEEEWQKRQPSLSKKLFAQLIILKTQLGMGTPKDFKLINEHKAVTSNLLRPTMDVDGFRRQIIVTCSNGKVASLHSGDGRVLWETNFPSTDGVELKVHPWFESEAESVLAVFAISKDSTHVYLVDTYSGHIVEDHAEIKSNGSPLNIVPVEPMAKNHGEQHVFALVDISDNVIEIAPLNELSAKQHFETKSHSMVKWGVSQDKKSVYGVRLTSSGPSPVLWKFRAAATDDVKILDISARDKTEAIYSAAKPIYGGGVLIKNVNPNMLLVITGTDIPTSKITATALDAISGKILYSQEHKRATGPIKSILSEHWAAYNYWNEEQGRWYIGVIDTYIAQPADLTAASLLLSSHHGNNTVSAYDEMPELIIESQSFRTKYGASCLSVTQTAHGTAAKMLLFGTTSGQIISIDRRMIDPRRPKVLPGSKPTPQQAYERLPPFHPELPVNGPSFITLYHTIERLKSIKASAAILESSSLVFAHGLDSYFIRLQPSRGFDMVPDDFPHALLVFMVLFLAAALATLRAIIQKRTLKLKWQ